MKQCETVKTPIFIKIGFSKCFVEYSYVQTWGHGGKLLSSSLMDFRLKIDETPAECYLKFC